MKAIIFENFGGIENLKLAEVAIPEPQPNEVQIQVAYAGVNPLDWKIHEGYLRELTPHKFPIILGWDVAGTVVKVGSQVSDFKVGDKVFALAKKLVIKEGTFAEYVCIPVKDVALKPEKLSLKEAAALPLVSLTAWQALVVLSQLQPNETVLIHAGGGGVGSIAIQIAKHCQAKVVTTVSPAHVDYVKRLGADVVIDYTKENFVEKIKELFPEGIDVILDTIGDEVLQGNFAVLKSAGRLVSIRQQIDPKIAGSYQANVRFLLVKPNGAQLKTIAGLFDDGSLVSPQIEEYPLDHFNEALIKVREGHTQGKVVLRVS